MSTSPTEPDIDNMDVRELRQLLKDQTASLQALKDHNTMLEKDKSDAELALLAQKTNSFSPAAQNLSASLNAAAPMDAQQVTAICEKLLSQMKKEILTAV